MRFYWKYFWALCSLVYPREPICNNFLFHKLWLVLSLRDKMVNFILWILEFHYAVEYLHTSFSGTSCKQKRQAGNSRHNDCTMILVLLWITLKISLRLCKSLFKLCEILFWQLTMDENFVQYFDWVIFQNSKQLNKQYPSCKLSKTKFHDVSLSTTVRHF